MVVVEIRAAPVRNGGLVAPT